MLCGAAGCGAGGGLHHDSLSNFCVNIIYYGIEFSALFGIYIYTVCSLSCCKVNYHESNPATHDSNGRVTAHEHQGQELQPLQSENDLVQDGAVDDQWDGNG